MLAPCPFSFPLFFRRERKKKRSFTYSYRQNTTNPDCEKHWMYSAKSGRRNPYFGCGRPGVCPMLYTLLGGLGCVFPGFGGGRG